MLELLTGAILGFCIGGLTVLLYMSLKEPEPEYIEQIDANMVRITNIEETLEDIEKSITWHTDHINGHSIKIQEQGELLKDLDKYAKEQNVILNNLDKYARELDEYMHNVV